MISLFEVGFRSTAELQPLHMLQIRIRAEGNPRLTRKNHKVVRTSKKLSELIKPLKLKIFNRGVFLPQPTIQSVSYRADDSKKLYNNFGTMIKRQRLQCSCSSTSN